MPNIVRGKLVCHKIPLFMSLKLFLISASYCCGELFFLCRLGNVETRGKEIVFNIPNNGIVYLQHLTWVSAKKERTKLKIAQMCFL